MIPSILEHLLSFWISLWRSSWVIVGGNFFIVMSMPVCSAAERLRVKFEICWNYNENNKWVGNWGVFIIIFSESILTDFFNKQYISDALSSPIHIAAK